MAEAVLARLKAPTVLREQVVQLIGKHMTKLEPDKKLLRRRLGKLGRQQLEMLLNNRPLFLCSKTHCSIKGELIWQEVLLSHLQRIRQLL